MQANSPIKTNDIVVGDRIIIVLKKENHLDRGYVRYIGELAGLEGTYYGIELDEAKGLHDGKNYFKTQDKHGTFMKLTNLRKIVDENFRHCCLQQPTEKGAVRQTAKQRSQTGRGWREPSGRNSRGQARGDRSFAREGSAS